MQGRNPNQIDPDNFRQAIFATLSWNTRSDKALNDIADAPADPAAIREAVYKNYGTIMNVGNIDTFRTNYDTNGKNEGSILSNADALQLRDYARHDRSKIIANHIVLSILQTTDPTVLNDLSTNPAQPNNGYRDKINKHRKELQDDFKTMRVHQLNTLSHYKIQFVAKIAKAIQQKTLTNDATLVGLAALQNGAVPTADEMRNRLKNALLQGAQYLDINEFNRAGTVLGQNIPNLLNYFVDSLSPAELGAIHVSAENQIAINTMRTAMDRMLNSNNATLAALIAQPIAPPPENTVRGRLIANLAHLGGNNPAESNRLTTAINRLNPAQISSLYTYALDQVAANRTVDRMKQMEDPQSPVLNELVTAIQAGTLPFKTALEKHKGALGLVSANINRMSPIQITLIAIEAEKQLIQNKTRHYIGTQIAPNDAFLQALTAPQLNADPSMQDISDRLNQNKNLLGLNPIPQATFNALATTPVPNQLLNQAIQQLTINRAKELFSNQLQHDNALLTAFTALVQPGGTVPTPAQIKQRIMDPAMLNASHLFPGLSPGLVNAAITAMPDNTANALYLRALKQLIINKMKHGIDQTDAAADPTLTALHKIRQNAALTPLERTTALFNQRTTLGVNFPPALDAPINMVCRGLAPAEYDDIYQRASDKLAHNNFLSEIRDGIGNLSGATEHNNAMLVAIITRGTGVNNAPTPAEIKHQLFNNQTAIFAIQRPQGDFTGLSDQEAIDFYRQALKQLSENKIYHAIEQKNAPNDPLLSNLTGAGANPVPTEAEIKLRLTTNKAMYGLNFDGNDAHYATEITNAVNAMSAQETHAFYIAALKQKIIASIREQIPLINGHENNLLTRLNATGTGGGGAIREQDIKDRLFAEAGNLNLNLNPTNAVPMNTALRDAVNTIPDGTLRNVLLAAENQLANNKIRHAISQKTAHDDPTLAALTAIDPATGNPPLSSVFKNRIVTAKADLGLQSVRDGAITGAGVNGDAFYVQAVNQKAINTINHEISLKTTHGNAVLDALVAGATDANIKTNFIAQKAALGNIDDAVINRLQTPELQALLASAQKQKIVNAVHNAIDGIQNANAPVFDAIVGNPVNDVLEMKRLFKLQKAGLGLQNNVQPNNALTDTLIDGFSDTQTRGIYNKILSKRAEMQPYFKLLDGVPSPSPLRTVLIDPLVAAPLKAYFAPLSPQAGASFIDKLNDPQKEKAQIAQLLTSEAGLAPPATVDNLAKFLFAENQYKRVLPTLLLPALQAEFTSSRGTGADGKLLDKLGQKNTAEEIDELVNAVKESSKSMLPGAMRDLGLDPLRANAYFAEREYARLRKEFDNDPFLKPLLQDNEPTIRTALASPAFGSAQQIDAHIKRIRDAGSNSLMNELAVLGITHKANPAGGAPIALNDDETFANKAYHQILNVIGDTIGSELEADADNVKAELQNVSQADINDFIKQLKETATRSNIIQHINGFLANHLNFPALAFDPANADLRNQVFAEVQYARMLALVKPGELKTQMEAQKPQMIEAIKKNRELINTPEQAFKLFKDLRTSFYVKTDLQNAMGALGLATPPKALNALLEENRKIYEERMRESKPGKALTAFQYSQINNNIESFFSKVQHYHQLTSTALTSMGDRNVKVLNRVDHLTFRLKEHLLLYRKSLEDIQARRVTVNWLDANELTKITTVIREIDKALVKIAQIEANLATIRKQMETKTGPERFAYFSSESNVPAKVGTADEIRDFTADYLSGDDQAAGAPLIAAQVNSRAETIKTTEKFGGATERAVPIKIMMREEEIREEGRLQTAAKKAGIALNSALFNERKPPREIRGVLHQTYNPDTKAASTKLEMSEDDIIAINSGEKVGYGFRSAKIPNDAAMRAAIDIIEGARVLNPNATEMLELKANNKCPELLEAMVLYCKFMQKNSQLSGYDYTTPYEFQDKLTKEHENVLHKRLNDKGSGIYDLRHKAMGAEQAAKLTHETTIPIRPGKNK